MPYQNLLTDDERSLLLDELRVHATDDILLNAVSEVAELKARVTADISQFRARRRKQLEVSGGFNTPAEPPAPLPVVTEKVPPGDAAARVTTPTLNTVKHVLGKSPATAETINLHLKGRLPNTVSMLKLLWQRKIVAFNGTEYLLT
jgi:hypothetical protein